MKKLLSLLMAVVIVAAGAYGLSQLDSGGFRWPLVQSPPPAAPPVKPNDAIRIATFNLNVFGEKKVNDPQVVDFLARICRHFDIIAVQEIRSLHQNVLPLFVEALNADGSRYEYVIGPRLGRSDSKEQYAYIFDAASVEVDRTKVYTLQDADDLLHREPLVAAFRVRGPQPNEAFTFNLINIHVDPDETDRELDVLDNVFLNVRDLPYADGSQEDDVILLGDLNVNDRHLRQLGRVKGIAWVVTGDQYTNTRRSAQYDNILFDTRATTEFTGRFGVFDFCRQYGLTDQQALLISDHFPVWAEFSVFEGGATQMAGDLPQSR
ncbi:MAG TPA: endonuclease/exonuclease/phosphatase family protein [Pirellulaceae bacterium]|nr:endonuclease/exonuclease/phosphatase family protein [Pirellulaceae bacterium]